MRSYPGMLYAGGQTPAAHNDLAVTPCTKDNMRSETKMAILGTCADGRLCSLQVTIRCCNVTTLILPWGNESASYVDNLSYSRMMCSLCRQLSVIRDSSSRGGLRASTERAAKHRLLSQLAYLRVTYTIRWPLNVVITQDQLKSYQDVLPVFLQVCDECFIHSHMSTGSHALITGHCTHNSFRHT